MFTSPSVRTRRRVAGSRALGGEQQNSQRQSQEYSQEYSQEALSEPSQEQTSAFNYKDDELEPAQEAGSEGEHTLLRGDRHAVFEVGAMPPAARQLLASSDEVSCGVSEVARFAFVATASTCVVWSFAAGSSAAVHRLAMPDGGEGAGTPAVALVAGVGAGDVGVVAVGGLGHVRYWDRVVFGLGGASQFHSAALALAPTDRCEQIAEASAGLLVVGTGNGSLYGVSLVTAQGAAGLDVRALSRTGGSRGGVLSRMASLLGGSSGDGGSSDQLVSVARGGRTEIRHSREVYALTRSRLAKWVVSSAHPERLAYTIDLHHALADVVGQALDLDAELHFYDVAAAAGGDVCVLVGAGPSLAIVALRAAHVASEPSVAGLTLLRHTAPHPPAQSGAGRPRLVIPAGGPIAFVTLDQAVVAAAVPALGVSFEETVKLRYGDCVLAATAMDDQHAESCVLVACRRAGILRVAAAAAARVDSAVMDADVRIGRPQQEQIEQAVFFGCDAARNPLAFAITSDAPGLDAHLQAGALRVSHAILDGSSRFVADRLDVGSLLRERLRRAHGVIQALAENGLAEKLSTSARAQLSANAEKLAAAQALWDLQNAAWARTGPALQLLANLAAAFLESAGQQASKDPLRLFFRLHCAAVGDLLVLLHRRLPALTRALAVSASGVKDSQVVSYEASRIAAAVLQSALAYRFQHARLYAVADPAPERWTEHPAIADLLVDRLKASYALCRDLSAHHCKALYERITATALPGDERPNDQALRIFDDAVSVSHASLDGDDDDALRPLANATDEDPHTSPLALLCDTIDQIGPLANLCFRVFVDRIARLTAANSANAHDVIQRYDTLRPRFLLCLVPLGRAPVAFRLAEEYRDLASLVTLVFVADPANAAAHLRRYVDRFSKDFADTLFAFYERRAAWASLLHTQDDQFDAWLKDYIDLRTEEEPHAPLAQYGWIHDVKVADFSAAATRLAHAGLYAEEVDHAQTMLSLSKLAFIASESQKSELDDTMLEARARLDKALELRQVQAGILHYFTMLLGPNASNSDDRKAAYDIALHTTTPELRHSHPSLYIVFTELVRRMWNRLVLPIEDLIDVLTIPDNLYALDTAADADDQDVFSNNIIRDRFSLAIDILSCTSFGLPEQTRESALRSIWRRVFLSDNWPEIHRITTGNVPDSVLRSELLNTTLYRVLHSCLVARNVPHPEWYLLPSDVFATTDIEYLVSTRLMPQFGPESANNTNALWKPLTTTTAPALTNDYTDEDKHLQTAIDCGLNGYYSEILRIVVEQASTPSLDGNDDAFASNDDDSDDQMDTD